MSLSTVLCLLGFLALGSSKVVVYNATTGDCPGLLYFEEFVLNIARKPYDLSQYEATTSCIKPNKGKDKGKDSVRVVEISFSKELNDKVKNLKVSFNFSSTDTGYWNSVFANVKYNDGTNDLAFQGKFEKVYFVAVTFSYACSTPSNITLVETGVNGSVANKAYLKISKYQMQTYSLIAGDNIQFFDKYSCNGFITRGAWMGIFTSLVLVVVLVFSIMMLLATQTPDRFETSKSKCLIIPHEH